MLGMFLANVLEPKIIYHQVKYNGECCMCPQSRGECGLVIPMEGKALDKEMVCKDTTLGQSIHSLPVFHVDVTIGEVGVGCIP
jgi:hypothetical protein